MKKSIRYLSSLLAMILLVMSLSSCISWLRIVNLIAQEEPTSENEGLEDPKPQVAYGKEFTLSQNDEDLFLQSLQTCLDLIKNNAPEAEIDAAMDTMEALFYHIATQADLAYVLYCMNQNDAKATENYLYSSQLKSDVYYAYAQMCQEVDTSSYPYRDRFFSDWSENDSLQMRLYTEEVNAINKENDAILVEYRDLDRLSESFADDVCRLYLQMIENNDTLAKKFGFSDYASYAYEGVYERDYSRAELATLRSYVQTYLVPLSKQAYDAFFESYQNLSASEVYQVGMLLNYDYDADTSNLLASYFSSLTADMKAGMEQMLTAERSVFTDSVDAYAGAFTGYFYDENYPVCYFGPGYQTLFTIAHEAGHYYAALCEEGLDIDLDLAEVHSQGNEWLLLAYAKNSLSANAYTALKNYMIYQSLAEIVVCTLIDHFEEVIYTSVAMLDGSAAQMDAIMSDLCTYYGGEEFLDEYMVDISEYWKYVVIESPVYYISYAVSGIASMTLYGLAIENYETALQIYGMLIEDLADPEAFLGTLNYAGLATPFDQASYLLIAELLK